MKALKDIAVASSLLSTLYSLKSIIRESPKQLLALATVKTL
jgi:hypothetical protein